MRTNDEAIWETFKDIFFYINYLFISKEDKLESNLRLVREKYWFQQIVEHQPSILEIIESDNHLKAYFSSRKKVRKLLRDREERQRFKSCLEDKVLS